MIGEVLILIKNKKMSTENPKENEEVTNPVVEKTSTEETSTEEVSTGNIDTVEEEDDDEEDEEDDPDKRPWSGGKVVSTEEKAELEELLSDEYPQDQVSKIGDADKILDDEQYEDPDTIAEDLPIDSLPNRGTEEDRI